MPDISSNTMAYHVPVLRILSLRRFFVRISSFHFLYSILVWLLHAYGLGRCAMGFRVCGQLFPCACCLSYCICSLAEYLYLCGVCRWMNTECSLCKSSRSFLCCLWFVLYYLYNWCFNFTNPFGRPIFVICCSLWSFANPFISVITRSAVSFAKSLIP